MNGYVPQHLPTLAAIAATLLVELGAAWGISRLSPGIAARVLAWLLVITATTGVFWLSADEPAGVQMLAIIAALLLGMKAVVSVEETMLGRARLTPGRWLLFACGWPGMRPSVFAKAPGPPRRGWPGLMRQGARSLLAGTLLLGLVWLLANSTTAAASPSLEPWNWRWLPATLLLLAGLSLLMHFGLFDILAGAWRWGGADCQALFRAPWRSTSLTEFWGRRWNLAFSEMTALSVYRPLRNLTGARVATLAAFLFSGLLHEMAISLPVHAGYGLPLTYFALHALAMQIEQQLIQRGRPIDRRRWLGRLWTAAWILLPLPILFHTPFLRGCVWPLVTGGE